MRLVIVHRNDLGRLFAIFAIFFWRKDRAQSAERENAKEQRGFDRSRHGDVNLTRAVNSWFRAHLLRWGRGEAPQILKGIKTGAMAVSPPRLERVTANQLPTNQLEARRGIRHIGPRNISEHVRLAATSGARTGAPEALDRQIRFHAITPSHGQLVSD
jgi:hypothetical protein